VFILFGKFVTPLITPLGFAFALWVTALLCYWRGGRRVARMLTLGGMAVILVFANSLVGDRLLGGLEDDFEMRKAGDYPQVDAVVVLGGVTLPSIPPRLEVTVGPGFDRLLHGMRLLRAGKGRFLILSGGTIPSLVGSEVTEAIQLQSLALEYGIPPEAILLEGRSRNTYENAIFTQELLEKHGLEKVLLVTSASHMRRSVAVFQTQGVEVIPAPTDVRVVELPSHLRGLVPTLDGLEFSTIAIKEHVGWWVYRLKGWIDSSQLPGKKTD
jgi:uncharacterized SAM-binding protein YcdF (DUF218 family)